MLIAHAQALRSFVAGGHESKQSGGNSIAVGAGGTLPSPERDRYAPGSFASASASGDMHLSHRAQP